MCIHTFLCILFCDLFYSCSINFIDITLCVCVQEEEEEFRARPRLDIIQPLAESCEEISSDALSVRNFTDNECRDYRLGEASFTRTRTHTHTVLLGPGSDLLMDTHTNTQAYAVHGCIHRQE